MKIASVTFGRKVTDNAYGNSEVILTAEPDEDDDPSECIMGLKALALTHLGLTGEAQAELALLEESRRRRGLDREVAQPPPETPPEAATAILPSDRGQNPSLYDRQGVKGL